MSTIVDVRRLKVNVPIVLKSGSHVLLESSGPVQGLLYLNLEMMV